VQVLIEQERGVSLYKRKTKRKDYVSLAWECKSMREKETIDKNSWEKLNKDSLKKIAVKSYKSGKNH